MSSLLTRAEAARELAISVRSLDRLILAREIEVVRPPAYPRMVRITRRSLEVFIRKNLESSRARFPGRVVAFEAK